MALPDWIPFASAAALGCRFATAFRALVSRGRVQPGERVAVFGCGGVGLSGVLIATALGASVTAVDVDPAALARARELGAHETALITDPADTEAVAAAVRDRNGDGVHVALDAIGSEDTVRACIGALRRRGRHVQVGLLFGAEARSRVPMDRVLAWELDVLGSHGIAARDHPELFRFLQAHDMDLGTLVGQVLSLDHAGAALQEMTSSPPAPGMTVLAIEPSR